MKTVDNVDDYIAGFPEKTREILQQVRQTIKKTAPQSGEKISYGILKLSLIYKESRRSLWQ